MILVGSTKPGSGLMDMTGIVRPAEQTTLTSISERAATAQAMLRRCTFCELRCDADRTATRSAPCRLGADSYAYKRYTSLNEEPELIPALRVFLGGCNLRCRFCDEAPDCLTPDLGQRVVPKQFAMELQRALGDGVRSITLLGGEPTLHVHTILATAACCSRSFPLALDTNMYMTPEVLDLLDGVVGTYLADFKFGNDECAAALAGVPRYLEVVCRNVKRAAGTSDVIVRHVLIPGHFDCCFRPIVDWVAANLPGGRFQLYPGYVPCWHASDDPEIARLNTPPETRRAMEYVEASGLRHRVVTGRIRDYPPNPRSDGTGDASITIGADGRLYCHDLTPELASILGTLLPEDRKQTAPHGELAATED